MILRPHAERACMTLKFAHTEFTKNTVGCTADIPWMSGLRQNMSWTRSIEGSAAKRNKCISEQMALQIEE